jgi:hypothetical protein
MAKLFPKHGIVLIAFLTIAIGLGMLWQADLISFQGLQGDILNVNIGYYEPRFSDGRIAAEVRVPTEVILIDQDDFRLPIMVIPREGNVRLIEIIADYTGSITPGHYISGLLKDQGSTLLDQHQEILATIENTPSEGEPLLKLRGDLDGEEGEIQISLLRFAIGDEILEVSDIQTTIGRGEAP